MKGWIGCSAVVFLLAGILLAVFVWAIATYHGLVGRQIDVDRAWYQVENAYQRRLDLIPSLVETAERGARFDKETCTAVTTARKKVRHLTVTQDILDDPERFRSFEQAQEELSRALARLLLAVEGHPALRAKESLREVQSQLESTAIRIAEERRKLDESVGEYNAAIHAFPARLLAGALGFSPKLSFEASVLL